VNSQFSGNKLMSMALAPAVWTGWQAQSASRPAAPKLGDLYQLSL
jgi:hypothetical protein